MSDRLSKADVTGRLRRCREGGDSSDDCLVRVHLNEACLRLVDDAVATKEETGRAMAPTPKTIRREVARAKFWLEQRIRQG